VIFANFFKSHIKLNVRTAERFYFATGEEINLLVDKAVTENTKKPLQTLLASLTIFIILTQCSNTQARCGISLCSTL